MNKFPDKILLTQDTETGNLHDEWVLRNLTQCKDMEYIRKDVFIDKACEWLEEVFSEYENLTDYNPMKDFRKAMEE